MLCMHYSLYCIALSPGFHLVKTASHLRHLFPLLLLTCSALSSLCFSMPLATALQVESACKHVIILALQPQLNELCLPVFTSVLFLLKIHYCTHTSTSVTSDVLCAESCVKYAYMCTGLTLGILCLFIVFMNRHVRARVASRRHGRS